MLQKQLLSFEEVGVELGCSVGTVRSLVVEERSLPALVVTLTGGKQPYGAQTIERIDDDGTVLVLHDRPSRFERGFKAYLRVERIALTTFWPNVASKPLGRAAQAAPTGRNTTPTSSRRSALQL